MKQFRVWDKKNKRMYYDNFFIGTFGELYRLSSYFNIDDDKYIVNLKPANMKMYNIMFSSELSDCNGILLYENDIIETNQKKKYIITYNKGKGIFLLKGIDTDVTFEEISGDIKCIGNIYENINDLKALEISIFNII